MQERRAHALALFDKDGLPHRRIEDWKYTDLRNLMREINPVAPALDAAALKRATALVKIHRIKGAVTIALVDGAFVAELSDLAALEAGVTVRPLSSAIDDIADKIGLKADSLDSMAALNLAMAGEGAVIEIADNALLTKPVHLLHVAVSDKPVAIYTRSLVRIGRDARLTLVESFDGPDTAYQVNDAVAISVGVNAELQHVRFMRDGSNAINVTTAGITLAEHARLNTFNMTSGTGVSRYQTVVRFEGRHAHATTSGINLLRGRQHGDTTLFVDHAVPDGASREMFRAVVDERGHSVFQGRIVVQPHAQKTDAKMMTRALLLSDEAEADNKPELEIFADDVTCGHGSTAGALDESLLFYLRARGLDEAQAQALLIQAFVGEAIETIADERLRETAVKTTERWLAARV